MVISGFEEGGGWGVSRWVESGCGGGVGGSMFGEAQSQPIDAVGEVESDTEMSALKACKPFEPIRTRRHKFIRRGRDRLYNSIYNIWSEGRPTLGQKVSRMKSMHIVRSMDVAIDPVIRPGDWQWSFNAANNKDQI